MTARTIIEELRGGKAPFSTIKAASENVYQINQFLKGLDSNLHVHLERTIKEFQLAESELQVGNSLLYSLPQKLK